MKLMPITTTATNLQRNYKKVRSMAKKSKKPIVVLSNNKPELVVMDYDYYNNVVNNKGLVNYVDDKRVGKLTVSDNVNTAKGIDGLVGSWTDEEAEEFNKRIDEMFENIDEEMWK